MCSVTFTFPVDFVIMDIEEDAHVPLILGRPFLNTARPSCITEDILRRLSKLLVSEYFHPVRTLFSYRVTVSQAKIFT